MRVLDLLVEIRRVAPMEQNQRNANSRMLKEACLLSSDDQSVW